MLRFFLFSLALLVALPLSAQNARAVRRQAESSLRLSGSLVIGTDGAVQEHQLDPGAPLSPALAAFVDQAIGQWRFQPVEVNGSAVRAKVAMSLRLVARRAEDGKYSVRIASTHFGDNTPKQGPKLIPENPPRYPKEVAIAGGEGTVYLVAQVGADGKVRNVDAEQVNLYSVGTEKQMAWMRKLLADASISAARTWRFTLPADAAASGKDSWLVRLPVQFLVRQEKPKPGDWETYIPGPRNMNMPWAQQQLKMAGNPDALPDNGVFPLEEGAKLLTPSAP
ncbi:energy transducer TonB [Thermomonas brevis]|uniref:Energy transducer TonB n=1 Tax=Thermomonas brevis TaxID=215691 RepID=A0A7G9QPZ4_9GAMM|nr:energy transducer TonB [Thermomonas brevis]QNN45419.1 energy transducer TonB [Thermomonas brevis]